MTIVVAGSTNLDLCYPLERIPVAGETVVANGTLGRHPGGKGANQAAAVARLGHPCRFVGQVGEDDAGRLLTTALAEAGVDTAGLRRVAGPSGSAVILVAADGENAIVVDGGANRAWERPTQAQLAALDGASHLLLQREIPVSVNCALAEAARLREVHVVLDAGGDDAPLPAGLLALIDTLSPNRSELARLVGKPPGEEGDAAAIREAAHRLQAQGVGTVLVKLGADGCLLVQGDGSCWHQGAFPARVVDTTGAGDCFTAAWAVAQARGDNHQASLAFACAAASCAVETTGAMPAMPDLSMVAERALRNP